MRLERPLQQTLLRTIEDLRFLFNKRKTKVSFVLQGQLQKTVLSWPSKRVIKESTNAIRETAFALIQIQEQLYFLAGTELQN